MDASVWVEYLLPGRREDDSRQVIDDPANELLVPDLVFLEVASALARLVAANELTPGDLADCAEELLLLTPVSFSSRSLLPSALSYVPSLTPYDAVYLALAAERGCRLASFDHRLNRAAREAGVPLAFA